jgi:nitrogen fixation NifU-like protein
MSSEDLYREIILDHHKHPRGAAPLAACNASSTGMNPSCGDEVSIRLNIEGDKVEGAEVISKGCAISTASGSILAEKVSGMHLAEVRKLAETVREMLKTGQVRDDTDLGDFEALGGVSRFPVRVKCAMLPIAAMLQALDSVTIASDSDEQGRGFKAAAGEETL